MQFPIRGTIFNCLLVLIGCLIGYFLQNLFDEELIGYMKKGLGLTLLLISSKLFANNKDLLTVLVSIIIGSAIGGAIGIRNTNAFIESLCFDCIGIQGDFAQSCINATILISVGPLTILGIIEEATTRDLKLMKFKSFLDGTSAVLLTLAETNPIGVFLSIFTVFLLQAFYGVLIVGLNNIVHLKKYLGVFEGVGAVLILSVALNILHFDNLPTLILAPGLIVAPFIMEMFAIIMPDTEQAKA